VLIPIADILVEEVDVTRAEFTQRCTDLESNMANMQKQIKTLQSENIKLHSDNTKLRTEVDAYRQTMEAQFSVLPQDRQVVKSCMYHHQVVLCK